MTYCSNNTARTMPNPRPPSAKTPHRLRSRAETGTPSQSLHISQLVQHFASKDSQHEGVSEPIQLGKVLPDTIPVVNDDVLSKPSKNDDVPCQRYLHENLRALWYCTDLKRRVCYCCSEMLTDNGNTLVGGLPELALIDEWIFAADPESTLFRLNSGQEMTLNLAILRCPCGTPFQHSTQSAICSMCCTATCTAACHKNFAQDQGLCIYNLNFIPAAQPEVHGCRDIRWCVIERTPPATYLSRVCGPRYLEAITGPDSNTLMIRRGYGQYGQPLASTLIAMTPVPPEARRTPSIFRRNLCRCPQCQSRQPHAVLHCKCDQVKLAESAAQPLTSAAVLPALNPLSTSSRPGNPFATAPLVADIQQAPVGSSRAVTATQAGSASNGVSDVSRGATTRTALPDILTNSQSLHQSRKVTAVKVAIEDENEGI